MFFRCPQSSRPVSWGVCEMESESDEDEVLYGEAPRRVSFNSNVQQSTFELEEEDDPLGKLSRLSGKQSELEYSESSS